QSQRLTQLPSTKIQEQDFSGNGNQADRVNRKNRSRLRFGGVKRERLAYLAAANEVPHRPEDCLQWVDKDQDRNDHPPANQNRSAIFEAVTPTPQPTAPPKDAQHREAADKCPHIPDSLQDRLDAHVDLLRSDHALRNSAGKR